MVHLKSRDGNHLKKDLYELQNVTENIILTYYIYRSVGYA